MITAKWLTEGLVCLSTVPAVLESSMLKDYDTQMMQMLDSAPGHIYIIVDLRLMEIAPSVGQILLLKHIRHPHVKHALTIGLSLNAVSRFLVPVVSQMVGIHYKDFSSVEEALEHIERLKV